MLDTIILCVTSGKTISTGVLEETGAVAPVTYGIPDTWYDPTLLKPTP